MSDDRPARVRLAPCDGCGSRFDRCPCDAAGDAFAAERGERLPAVTDGRLFGGHVGGSRGGARSHETRGGPRRLEEIVGLAEDVQWLRSYREWYEARVHGRELAAPRVHAEDERDRLKIKFMRLLLDGEGMTIEQAAERCGHGRQWGSRLLGEIRRDAREVREVEALGRRCEWHRCRGPIPLERLDGQPKRFCRDSHRIMAWRAMVAERREKDRERKRRLRSAKRSTRDSERKCDRTKRRRAREA